MTSDFERAREILSNGYTCVLCRGDEILTSKQKGIKPLLDFLDLQKDFKGFSAADKVIGKGAAFLYVLLGIKAVYAEVISEMAAAVFEEYDIFYKASSIVSAIKNRTKDGFCPIESAVKETDDPKTALDTIKITLNKLY